MTWQRIDHHKVINVQAEKKEEEELCLSMFLLNESNHELVGHLAFRSVFKQIKSTFFFLHRHVKIRQYISHF